MMYLTAAQLHSEILSVDYRHPAVDIEMFSHPFEGFNNVCVAIRFSAPNAYQPEEAQAQCVNVPVPPIVSSEHFHDWLRWRIAAIGSHEVSELYWVYGAPLHDPHSAEYWELRI